MILAIVQARMSSSRLPGKVLKEIMGKPMLSLLLERLRYAKHIDRIIIATSDDETDDILAQFCENYSIDCFRGSLEDVLDRFYQAALAYKAEHIVRITGDCPLIDPYIVDEVISLHREKEYDYTSNTLSPTFPDGLDVEVVRFETLKMAWEQATLSSEREHVTPYIYKHPTLFRIGKYKHSCDLSYMRWTVDEHEDLEFVTKIFQHLYKEGQSPFRMNDILQLLSKYPSYLTINKRFQRNEGYQKSLQKDKLWK
jgi:spore coat polysaccharide biosynthesis protein SpsF